jgi:hypothetical protein
LNISNNVPPGTRVGVLTARDASGNIIPCDYSLTKGSSGYFAVTGDELVTTWTTPTAPSYYSVRIHGIGRDTRFAGTAIFAVNVMAPVSPPTAAPSITVNGSNNAVVPEGAVIAVAVANGPGNTTDWIGLAAGGTPDTTFVRWYYLSGSQTPPAAGLTSATVTMTAPTTDGSYEARFYPDNGFVVAARTAFTVQGAAVPTPPAAPEPVITVTPTTPELPDSAPLGTVVATYAVTMSDGSLFTGTVGFAAPFYDAGGIFALSGNNIVINPAGPGVGPNMSTVTDHITLEALP